MSVCVCQMTIRVGAMQEDCFYLPNITPTHDIELEYQVNLTDLTKWSAMNSLALRS